MSATWLGIFFQWGLLILLSLYLGDNCRQPFLFPEFQSGHPTYIYYLPRYWPVSILLIQYKWQIFTEYKTIVPQYSADKDVFWYWNNAVKIFLCPVWESSYLSSYGCILVLLLALFLSSVSNLVFIYTLFFPYLFIFLDSEIVLTLLCCIFCLYFKDFRLALWKRRYPEFVWLFLIFFKIRVRFLFCF